MDHSLNLLDKALQINPTLTHWCKAMDLDRNVLTNARAKGRISPVVAVKLARAVGCNDAETEHWVAVAALEAANDPALLRLLRSIA